MKAAVRSLSPKLYACEAKAKSCDVTLPITFAVWQAEKQLAAMRTSVKKLGEDKASLFREVASLETQLSQVRLRLRKGVWLRLRLGGGLVGA